MTNPHLPCVDDAVVVEQHGRVLLVTINRPRAMNAVNTAVAVGVGEALAIADADPGTLAVILTGAGSTAFCAGADLKAELGGQADLADPRLEGWGFAGFTKHHISKPVIAAVNGLALGGGTEIVLQADLAIAVNTAKFGLPEVTHGLCAGAGGAFRTGQQLPLKVAMKLLLTGDTLSAQQAHRLGLINDVVRPADLLDAAFALADRICANAPLAVQATKRIARGMTDGRIPSEAADVARSAAEEKTLMASCDAREGLRAFTEKRLPVWTTA